MAWVYKRKDDGADPPELQAPQDRLKNDFERGYKRRDAIKRVPDHDDLGELKADRLAKWIATVRQSCAELNRADIADICLGKLLARAPVGEDGVWPREPVRQGWRRYSRSS